MRLTSIKLSGFKSFVDPTNFQVPGQLVGVVGPNGCGKSNIIDAVRWVLGESKASELRGESMQDVIFNGSTHRKPAGRSSVELLFDNALGKAAGQWSQYAEIAVKRTLTRDGASTYFINNQTVRRRDIQDIFMGTGLGPRAYAIIGQGMIARIIEARPEELRVFLEEAAGVSKYKERRRETENRLHDTRENLLRVDDIVRELSANLEKLQAQATVASQFHALQAEQDERQKLLWLLRKNEAGAEQQQCLRAMEQAQTDLERQTAELRRGETELVHLRQQHFAVGDHLHQAQGHLYQTNAAIGSLEAEIKFAIEARNRLQSRLQSLHTQRDHWQQQSQDHHEELAQAGFGLAELSLCLEQAQQAAQLGREQLPALEQAWRQAQQVSTQARAHSMQVQQQLELEAAQQRNASQVLTALGTRRARLAQEMQGLPMPDGTLLASVQSRLQAEQGALEQVLQQQAQAQQQQPVLEQERRAAQAQVNAESAQLSQMAANLAALKQLQESVQTQGKVQPWLNRHALTELPRLWQKLQIEAGWETALEAVLRERTAALEVSDIEWAKAFFSDAPPAKLALFSAGLRKAAGSGVAGAQGSGFAPVTPPGLKSLFSLLRLNDTGLRLLMQDWLRHVFVVEEPGTAFFDLDKLPPGGYFITRQGHAISPSCVRFYASDSEQDGMLERQRAIDNIGCQHRARQLLGDEAKARLVQAETAQSQVARLLQELQQNVNALTKTVHGLQIELVKLAELQARFDQRSLQVAADLAEISAQEAEQQQARAESELKFEQLDLQLAHLQDAYEQGQADYLDKEQQLNQARERLQVAESAAQEARFAEKTHCNRMDELRRNLATALEQAARLQADIGQGAQELENLHDQTADAGLQALLEKRSAQEHALSDARHELDQLTLTMRHLDEARLLCERSLAPLRDGIMALQLNEQAARLSCEQFALQLQEAQADEAALLEKLHPHMKAPSLQAEVTRLANAIVALGAVNLAALDELALASERKNFLDAQNADLSEAIATLENAIHKIDKETRALLQDTFDQVNLHFAELFPILFGGGQARLNMTGDEILNAGVQVMAQPPGKKNATIHLLSGGEKALTAIALVFSMFQLNPAPFCLLDEVDAPLDDANTERFCNMVKRMSTHTQFLFISHNKIAMEMAQQLIGVTMQEQGVSRIVAVDMESAANFSQEVQTA